MTDPNSLAGDSSGDPVCAVAGAGGHAKVAIAALRLSGFRVVGCYDDDEAKIGGLVLDVPVLGPVGELLETTLAVHLAIGSNRARSRLAATSARCWITAMHPRSLVDASAYIGPGALICMGAMIQVDARIGAHAIVNTGAIVEHDCQVGDFAHIAPAAALAGNVTVGEGALVGMGARILPGVRIGSWATVGAGAVVTRDVPPDTCVIGVPARATSRSRGAGEGQP